MGIPFLQSPIPSITTEQMIEVDRAMIEDYHIELIQMMENAGRNLAMLARERFFDHNPKGKKVIILAGTGGNGGGALVCARRLKNWGAEVIIYLTKNKSNMTPIPAHQLDILERMGVEIKVGKIPEETSNLIIEGVIGYSLKGAPRGIAKEMILWANEAQIPTLSLDSPAGIDLTSGTIFDPAIHATATMTLALPKNGLLTDWAKPFVGELYLADISVPPELYKGPKLGLDIPPIFAENDIVRLY